MAFVMAYPGVISAPIWPRTMQHLDDLLGGGEVVPSDEVLDRIDEIVLLATDVSPFEAAFHRAQEAVDGGMMQIYQGSSAD
jgi:hypothetical protein